MDLGFSLDDVFDNELSLDLRCLILEEHVLNLDGALPQEELNLAKNRNGTTNGC